MSAPTRRGAPPLAAIGAIASNTFREAIRERSLYLLLALSLVLIGVSHFLSMLTVGNEEKIVKDIGLSAISVFGVLTIVFLGVSLVFREIERKTVYSLLASPVRRWQFVVGKFGGLLAVLGINLCLAALALFVILLVRGESPWPLLPAILLILVELAMVTAFALLFFSLTNPVLAAVFTASIYVVGHLTWSLQLLKERIPEGSGRRLCDLFYVLLPNLERLNLKAQAVQGVAPAPGIVPLALLYGGGYTVLVLALACLAFQRKELP